MIVESQDVSKAGRSFTRSTMQQYDIGVTIKPTAIPHSKLFIFDTLDNAKAFMFQVPRSTLYKCYATNVCKPAIDRHFGAYSSLYEYVAYWDAYQTARKSKKKIKTTMLKLLPSLNQPGATVKSVDGTLWCDSVTLIERV